MALVTTIGSASANSYATVTEFYSYWSRRLIPNGQASPDSFGEDDVEAALLDAAVTLEQETYYGYRVTTTQALNFPRRGVYDDNGYVVSYTTIPQVLKDAQCELAYTLLLDPESLDGDALAGFQRIALNNGEVDLTPRAGATSGLPSRVVRLLRYLRTGSQARILIA